MLTYTHKKPSELLCRPNLQRIYALCRDKVKKKNERGFIALRTLVEGKKVFIPMTTPVSWVSELGAKLPV